MYNEYFGLEQTPFRLTPDTRLFYPGGGRGEVLDALVYAITTGEGIVKVVGEVGTGKTMLCRMLEERLPDAVEIVYLANPSLTPEDILHAIALELGLETVQPSSRIQIMHQLQQALLERHGQNRRVVALVEEAQSMPRDTLEEIRLLSNLETKSEKLLQIVLFGQPELDENLAAPEIRQLRERITHGFNLKTLSTDEIREYMEFRLRAAGYRGREAFSNKAYKVMSKASEGLTRRVNILADKSLLAAFAEDTHNVSDRHVKVAIEDTQLSVPKGRTVASPWWARAGGFVLAAAFGWIAAAWYADQGQSDRAEPSLAMVQPSQQPVQPESIEPKTQIQDLAPEQPKVQPKITQKEITLESKQAKVVTTEMVSTSSQINPVSVETIAKLSPKIIEQHNQATQIQSSIETKTATQALALSSQAGTQGSLAITEDKTKDAKETQQMDETVSKQTRQLKTVARTQSSLSNVSSKTSEPINNNEAQQVQGAASEQSLFGTQHITESTTQVVVNNATETQNLKQNPIELAAVNTQPVTNASVSSTTAGNTEDPENLLDQRLVKTELWLGHVNPRHYSIQVLATASKQRRNLQNFLQDRVRSGHIQDLYVYETRIDKKPWYGVLYGEFAEFSKAREALKDLPKSMTRHQPFIRNISDISIKKR